MSSLDSSSDASRSGGGRGGRPRGWGIRPSLGGLVRMLLVEPSDEGMAQYVTAMVGGGGGSGQLRGGRPGPGPRSGVTGPGRPGRPGPMGTKPPFLELGTEAARSRRCTGRGSGPWRNWSVCYGRILPTRAAQTRTTGAEMSYNEGTSPSPDSSTLFGHWTGDGIPRTDGGPEERAELPPEDQGELGAPVRDHVNLDAVEPDDVGQHQLGILLGRCELW